MDLTNTVKKLLLAGIGAVTVGAEKAAEVVDDLVAKGEITVEQGKTLTKELQEKAKQKKDDVVAERVAAMTDEQRERFRKALDDFDEMAKKAADFVGEGTKKVAEGAAELASRAAESIKNEFDPENAEEGCCCEKPEEPAEEGCCCEKAEEPAEESACDTAEEPAEEE